MKLVNKFTIWYIVITIFAMLIGGIILFYAIEAELIDEQARRLKDTTKLIAQHIEEGTEVNDLEGMGVSIEEIDLSAPVIPLRIIDTLAFFIPHNHNERVLKAVVSYKIKDTHYLISTFNYIGESDDIVNGITRSLLLTFLILLVLVVFASRLISGKILKPFNQAINAIRSFNIKQKHPIQLPSTTTVEFKELNLLLGKMTTKSVEDYQNLKEFSENASHELQTPLSIIRGKLELLMETRISETQAAFLSSIHNEVKKLSSINHSLTLLTKLENLEYQPNALDFSKTVNATLSAFEELIEIKHLKVEKKIQEDVKILLNSYLADILISNLLSNAIRHNVEAGSIGVTLDENNFTIFNTGVAPGVPTEQLFQRFKKTNQSSSSIGLGLSIVKQICELNNFKITYDFKDRIHTITISFK